MLYRIVFALLATTHLHANHDRLTASKAARDALHHMDPNLKTIFEYHCFGTQTRPAVALHTVLHLYDKTADRHSHHVQQQAEKYTREHLLAPEQREHRSLYAYLTMPPRVAQNLVQQGTRQDHIAALHHHRSSWDNDTHDLTKLTARATAWGLDFIEDRIAHEAEQRAHNNYEPAYRPLYPATVSCR